jgi:hypothetical protein
MDPYGPHRRASDDGWEEVTQGRSFDGLSVQQGRFQASSQVLVRRAPHNIPPTRMDFCCAVDRQAPILTKPFEFPANEDSYDNDDNSFCDYIADKLTPVRSSPLVLSLFCQPFFFPASRAEFVIRLYSYRTVLCSTRASWVTSVRSSSISLSMELGGLLRPNLQGRSYRRTDSVGLDFWFRFEDR